MIQKSYLGFFLSVVCIVMVAVSCKSSTSADVGVALGAIEANVDGNSWKASGATAVKNTANIGGSSVTAVTAVGAKILNQSSGDSETMEVTIYSSPNADNVSEGSYDVEDDGVPGAQFSFTSFVNGSQVSYFASSGTVKVTSISDDNVKGTFSGTVTNVNDSNDTKEISGGEFNVSIGFSF
ncbi:MAG: hypothetical protein FH748_16340 [Balneolaceae bacterium]|nr:hypothetical protein [Balneolaceae bacterium]